MFKQNLFFKKSLSRGLKSPNRLLLRPTGVLLAILAAGLLLMGADATDGVALFEKGDFHAARKVLSNAVAQKPDDSRKLYYLGRTYLALEDAEHALRHLTRAVELDSGNADYYFWLGVNYWALLDLDRELAAYDKALAIDPNYLPAHVYAGHNQLDRGQWETALVHYTTVLQAMPAHPEALYNTGLALKALDREEEARTVWRRYLQHHRTDRLAAEAARNLNGIGDFSYRLFPVGKRFIVGPSPGFKAGQADIVPAMAETLAEIGRLVQTQDDVILHIVAFERDDEKLAARRAQAAKGYIIENFPEIVPRRVRTSWFGQAETIQTGDRNDSLEASIKIFTAKASGNSQ